MSKSKQRFESQKSRGKLTSTDIEEENIKISKQQIKINDLNDDLIKAEEKLIKLRN